MSSISVAGDTSGSVTLQAPAISGSTVLTLPAVSGTVITNTAGVVTQAMLSTNVAGNGPAFSAYSSAYQNVTSNTLTKVIINTEIFDTNSNYDNVTNYRFTPTIAGYYQCSYAVHGGASGGTMQVTNACLYKNGTEYPVGYGTGSFVYATAVSEQQAAGSTLVYLNGSTDYIELWGKVIGTSPNLSGVFTTFLARSA